MTDLPVNKKRRVAIRHEVRDTSDFQKAAVGIAKMWLMSAKGLFAREGMVATRGANFQDGWVTDCAWILIGPIVSP